MKGHHNSKILLYKNQNQCKNSTNVVFTKNLPTNVEVFDFEFSKENQNPYKLQHIRDQNTTKSDFKLKKGDLPVTKSNTLTV